MFASETRILVVDDMMTMRKIVKKCLTENGFKDLTEADDGETAWAAIESCLEAGIPIQLVLSDWNMPKMKGIDLVRKIRANPKTKAVPVVLITAESEKAQIVEAISAGINGYIVKPFTAITVIEKLKAVHGALPK